MLRLWKYCLKYSGLCSVIPRLSDKFCLQHAGQLTRLLMAGLVKNYLNSQLLNPQQTDKLSGHHFGIQSPTNHRHDKQLPQPLQES